MGVWVDRRRTGDVGNAEERSGGQTEVRRGGACD